ncbi:MAG TPA: hypothetical protein VFP35_01555 [Candidatus Saccharimonadales bacterium]|nr:hypothetical protein [Candidatus Saccharimonadales bacterium]
MIDRPYLNRVLVAVAILALVIAGFILHSLQAKPTPPPVKPKSSAQSKPLTAGGQPVPAAYQARARKLGYYCPSWAAKPGTPVSTACLPLDH